MKNLIHQSCLKLGAHNRMEAIFFAVTQRWEISPAEFPSLDDAAEFLSPLSPDMLRRISYLVRHELGHGHLPGKDEQIILTDRRQDGILTQRERDVLVLAGRGLINREIADRLCISTGSVRIFLSRACTKLGARRRNDAVLLALKQREITVGEIASLDEVAQVLALLGTASIEKIAHCWIKSLGKGISPLSVSTTAYFLAHSI